MGFLEKFKLVEEDKQVTKETPPESEPTPVSVDAVGENAEFVSDVYARMQMDSKEDIFLLRDYIATLPVEMPDETKAQVVSGILSVSGVDPQKLSENAAARRASLTEAYEAYEQKNKAEIQTREADIESMKQMISTAQAEIYRIEANLKETQGAVTQELEQLDQYRVFADKVLGCTKK